MFTVNDCNMIIDAETVAFGTQKNYIIPTAEIRVGEHKGKWFLGLSLSLPLEGSSRGVSIAENEYNPAYATKEDAIEQGKREALRWLHGRVSKHRVPDSHQLIAMQAIKEIERSNQMSLF